MPHDVGDTQHRNRHKPDQGDRPEEFADATGTALLNKEQGKQHQQGDRNDVPLEPGGNDFQALDRRQHRDGWRDDAVAIEEGSAENADAQQYAAQARLVLDGL